MLFWSRLGEQQSTWSGGLVVSCVGLGGPAPQYPVKGHVKVTWIVSLEGVFKQKLDIQIR